MDLAKAVVEVRGGLCVGGCDGLVDFVHYVRLT